MVVNATVMPERASPHRSAARRRLLGGLAAGAALLAGGPARAQAWPTKPVRLVVPFAAGGGYDILARAVGARMQTALGQPIVIENRGGAAGALGAAVVARAAPDGYTVLLGSAGSQVVVPLTTPGLNYDPERDFVPIGHVATQDFLLVVPAASPYRTLREILEAARGKPESISYMSTGVRGAIHLFSAYLHKVAGGVSLTHVPYPGEGPAVADMLQGRVDMANITVTLAMPFIRDGRIRPIAAIGTQRSELLPDVPTVAEAGYPGPAMVSWVGLFGPAGTPPEAVATLNRTLNAALADPDIARRVRDSGGRSMPGSPEQFRDYIAQERARWSTMVREVGSLK